MNSDQSSSVKTSADALVNYVLSLPEEKKKLYESSFSPPIHFKIERNNVQVASLSEPSMSDFMEDSSTLGRNISQMDPESLEIFLARIDYLLQISKNDVDIKPDKDDISILLLRASLINCTLGRLEVAKAQAVRALKMHQSSLAYYRLGCALYCLSDFDAGNIFHFIIFF